MPFSKTIPTDKAAIQAEINYLLELTPEDTHRGRLQHLLNALVNLPPEGGDAATAPFLLGSWKSAGTSAGEGNANVFLSMSGANINCNETNVEGSNMAALFKAVITNTDSTKGEGWKAFLEFSDGSSTSMEITHMSSRAGADFTMYLDGTVAGKDALDVKIYLIPKSSKGATGGGGASMPLRLGRFKVTSVTSNPPVMDALEVGTMASTSSDPYDGDYFAMHMTSLDGIKNYALMYSLYDCPFVITIWDEDADPSPSGSRMKMCSFVVGISSSPTFDDSNGRVRFNELSGYNNDGSLQLEVDKTYTVFLVPVVAAGIAGFPNTIGALTCSAVTVGSGAISTYKVEFDTNQTTTVTKLRTNIRNDTDALKWKSMIVGSVLVLDAIYETVTYKVTALTEDAANDAITLTLEYIAGGNTTLYTNRLYKFARG